ncbi:MAG: tetratricopeptide repeat protein [Corynebacterium matruchotii]
MDKTLLQGLITAQLFMENGDLAGAKRALITLPPEYYNDPCQLLMLARVVCLEVQESEDFAEAITIFRQVARAGSREASILVNVAALALKIGYRDGKHAVRERAADHRLALDAVRQAIAVEPKLPVSYLIAARLIINLTLYATGGAELESLEAEAKAHLGQAETLGADPASVATLRVALMLVLGQLDAAREFLTDTHPQPRAVVVLRDYLAELDRPLTDRDRAEMAHVWAELREFLVLFPHFMARMGLSEDDDSADLRGCMLMQAALDLLDDDYGAFPMLLPPEGRQLLHNFHKHTIIVKGMAMAAWLSLPLLYLPATLRLCAAIVGMMGMLVVAGLWDRQLRRDAVPLGYTQLLRGNLLLRLALRLSQVVPALCFVPVARTALYGFGDPNVMTLVGILMFFAPMFPLYLLRIALRRAS